MSTHQPDIRKRNEEYNGKVPLGISIFPRDLSIPPAVQARTQGNIVFEKYHESGGHFAVCVLIMISHLLIRRFSFEQRKANKMFRHTRNQKN